MGPATAPPAELAELAAWIAFYREHRDLLLGGDLVRIDFPDEALLAGGVVAPDRRRAIYSFASLSRSGVGSWDGCRSRAWTPTCATPYGPRC